jgi:hypothetical protein
VVVSDKKDKLIKEIKSYDNSFLQIDDCATKELTELFSKPKKMAQNPGKARIFAFKQSNGRRTNDLISSNQLELVTEREETGSEFLNIKHIDITSFDKRFEAKKLFTNEKRGQKFSVRIAIMSIECSTKRKNFRES